MAFFNLAPRAESISPDTISIVGMRLIGIIVTGIIVMVIQGCRK